MALPSPWSFHMRGAIQTTPIITIEGMSLYRLRLNDISLGNRRFHFETGSFGPQGCAIDTGAAVTHLIEPVYEQVRDELVRLLQPLGLRELQMKSRYLCYATNHNYLSLLPKMTLHFQGADFHIEPEKLFIIDHNEGFFCWAMLPSKEHTTLGAFQQYNIRFLYDIVNRRLSFAPENCAQDGHH